MDIAEQISGCAEAGRLLNDLYRRQLFTDRRAGAQVTYQYHDLFREFLLARAEETYCTRRAGGDRAPGGPDPGGRRAGRRGDRAVSACRQTGDSVIELILRQAPVLLRPGARADVCERINALPAEQVGGQSVARVLAWDLFDTGRSAASARVRWSRHSSGSARSATTWVRCLQRRESSRPITSNGPSLSR